jgi:glycosyltransferase involved in cell wall biosynthesis
MSETSTEQPLIAVIVPVLGRPQNALPLARSLAEATTLPYRLVFVCSIGDHDQVAACHEVGKDRYQHATVQAIYDNPRRHASWARKINHAYGLTDERYLLLAADDLRFHPGWDTAVIEVAERTGLGVIGTNDLGNPTVMRGQASTHPLVARWYADAYGTVDGPSAVVSEAYAHNWVDHELCETAKARGMWAFAPDSHVEHLHPFWHKGADDWVYAAGKEHFAKDARLCKQRRRLWAQERRVSA